jgi:RNA polymerase sigma factor (sigma-70 family)
MDCAAALAAHGGMLRRVVAGMGFGAADGEDILQDVCAAMSQQGKLPPADEMGRWLVRVTVNRCLLEMRRMKRFTRAVTRLAGRQAAADRAPQGPAEQAIRAEEFEMVRGAMRKLDGPVLAAMVLTYYCGMDSTEVGRVLEANPSTVRSRLREGRIKMAEALLERGFEE